MKCITKKNLCTFCRSLMTHASVPENQRKVLGISDTLIRISVGLEDADDLIDDLRQALEIAYE